MMKYYALSGLVNAITATILGTFVYLKNRKGNVNRSFGLFCLSVAFWGYCYYFWPNAPDKASTLFWFRALHIGAIFIPVCYLHFVFDLLNIYKEKKKLLILGYILSFIFLIFDFTPLYIKDMVPKFSFKYWAEPGILYHFFLMLFFGCIFYAWYLMIRECRKSTGYRRNQIKYVLVGTMIGYLGGATNYPLWYNIPIYPYGNCLVAIYVAFVTYAIVAYRLMDINVVITRGLAYGSLTTVIAGAYVGLVVGVDRVFSRFTGYSPALAHSLLFIVVLFALIYVLPQMKIRAIEITRRTLFRGRYDYQRELSEATRVIPSMLNLEKLGNYILMRIRDTIMVNKLCLLVYSEVERNYYCLSSFGIDNSEHGDFKISENSALAGLLRESEKPLIKEELEKSGTVPAQAVGLAVEQMNSFGAEICIPLMIRGDLTGILTLSSKKTGEMYTEEDLSLLSALANQVALAIEYSKAVDKISSERRYVGLGKAAMRMAHDIKNPLVPLKTFLQILPDKYPKEFASMAKTDSEFTGRFYQSALEGVDRINLLIGRALHYARHPQPQFSPIELDNILDEVLAQEDVDLRKAKVEVERKYSPEANSIEADGEQLVELFSNIISNSIDAMDSTKTRQLTIITQALDGRVLVELSDTGCGISKDKIDTIFDPFITYKHKGSGLGLAIVKKIVEDHKGSIEVNSELGKGTSFKVFLPREQQKGEIK